jgi:hypothetical protein
MSINTEFYTPVKAITWQDQAVCEVRGITPHDLSQIMSEHAADVETLLTIFEGDNATKGIDPTDEAAILAAVKEHQGRLFSTIMLAVPALVAKLIAVACDAPDAWTEIRNKYPLPLQFEIVTEVAKLTFVDSNGFKAFVGNVMALAGNLSGNSQRHLAQ